MDARQPWCMAMPVANRQRQQHHPEFIASEFKPLEFTTAEFAALEFVNSQPYA